MQNDKQINPGSSNPIFEFSDKEPSIKRVEFLFSKMEAPVVKYKYDLEFLQEYIKLNVSVVCFLKAKDGNDTDTIEPIKNKYSYRVIKLNDFLPNELFIVLQNCKERLTLFLQQLRPPLKTLPQGLPSLVWEDNVEDLKRLCQEINQL